MTLTNLRDFSEYHWSDHAQLLYVQLEEVSLLLAEALLHPHTSNPINKEQLDAELEQLDEHIHIFQRRSYEIPPDIEMTG